MASKNKTETRATQRAERLAELKKQQQAQERRRNLMVGGVVAVVLVIIGAVFYFVSQGNDVNASDAGTSDYGVTIGPDDAPQKVVIYEDFLCPFCGQLEASTRDKLTELADAGKVQVDYRPFDLLGDYSARATGAFGVVLETSGQEVARKFHDLLYENQPEESSSSFPDAEDLTALAVQAGAEEAEVADGIAEGENDFAREATQEAQDAGVNSTPTVLVDGKVFTTDADGKQLLAELE